MVDQVAGAHLVDQAAGAHLVDQVARVPGVQVVVDQVAGAQVLVELKPCARHERIGRVAPTHDAFLRPIYSCAGDLAR